MRIFTKTLTAAGPEGVGDTQASYDIPGSTLGLGAIILAVIQVIGTLLGTYIGNVAQQQADRALNELRAKSFKVQLLQRVLEIEDTTGRAQSLKLLVASGLLDDKVGIFANSPGQVPKWIPRPLEAIDGTETKVNSNKLSNPSAKPLAPVNKDTGDAKGKPATEPM